MAHKLRKYASIWWANLVSKRARKGKAKIRYWDQMRDKLKDKFLHSHYIQDNYLNSIILNKVLRMWKSTLGSLNNSF